MISFNGAVPRNFRSKHYSIQRRGAQKNPQNKNVCGHNNIFGHSNGTISILEKGEIKSHKICDSSIGTIIIQNEMFLISNQAGQLYCKNGKKSVWEFYCSEELCLLSSIQSSELKFIFASTRTDNGSKLFLDCEIALSSISN